MDMQTMLRVLLPCLWLGVCAQSPVQMDAGPFEEHSDALKDTWISASHPAVNYGADQLLVAGEQTFTIIEFDHPVNPNQCEEAWLIMDLVEVDGAGTLTVWDFGEAMWANGHGPAFPSNGATWSCAVSDETNSVCAVAWPASMDQMPQSPTKPEAGSDGAVVGSRIRKQGSWTESADGVIGFAFDFSKDDEGHVVELDVAKLVGSGGHQFRLVFSPATPGDQLRFASLENLDATLLRPSLWYLTRKVETRCLSATCNRFAEPKARTNNRNALWIWGGFAKSYLWCFHPTAFKAVSGSTLSAQKAAVRGAFTSLNGLLHYASLEESATCTANVVSFYIKTTDKDSAYMTDQPQPALVKGAAEINLGGDWTFARGVIQHEFLHFFFFHLQNRPDYASWVEVGAGIRNDPDWADQYLPSPDVKAFGPWDYNGVMHYPFEDDGDNYYFRPKAGKKCPTSVTVMTGTTYDAQKTYYQGCRGGNEYGLTATDRIATERATGARACTTTSQCTSLGSFRCELSPLSPSFGFCRPSVPTTWFCTSYSANSQSTCGSGRYCLCTIPKNRKFCKGLCKNKSAGKSHLSSMTPAQVYGSCTIVPTIENAQLASMQECNSTQAGQTCPYARCQPGFALSGQLECDTGPEFSSIPTCQAVPPCSQLPSIVDPAIVLSSAQDCLPLNASKSCNTVQCKPNYLVTGAAFCTGALGKTVSLPSCVPAASCSGELNITEGSLSALQACSPLGPGQSCNITCNRGFVPSGPLVCSSDGSGGYSSLPTCQRVPACSSRPTIAHVDIASLEACLPLTSASSCITVRCAVGYEISGTLLCSDRGSQFAQLPICAARSASCTSDPDVVGAEAVGIASCLPTVAGKTCSTFRCQSGLKMQGTLRCSASGLVWDRVPLCSDALGVQQACVSRPTIINADLESIDRCLPVAAGNTCAANRQIECLPGYTLSAVPVCEGPEWTAATCQPEAPCSMPEIANVDSESLASCFPLAAGWTCEVACAAGYAPRVRPATLSCSKGTLVAPLPTCEPATPCTQIPTEGQAPNVPPEEWSHCLPLQAGASCEPFCYSGDKLSGALRCSAGGGKYEQFPSCYGPSLSNSSRTPPRSPLTPSVMGLGQTNDSSMGWLGLLGLVVVVPVLVCGCLIAVALHHRRHNTLSAAAPKGAPVVCSVGPLSPSSVSGSETVAPSIIYMHTLDECSIG